MTGQTGSQDKLRVKALVNVQIVGYLVAPSFDYVYIVYNILQKTATFLHLLETCICSSSQRQEVFFYFAINRYQEFIFSVS